MRQLSAIAFVLLLIGLQYALLGQTTDTIQLRQIEVSGNRISDPLHLEKRRLDSMVLNIGAASDLGVLLSRNSNVYFKSIGPGGLTTASFRGTGANHTKVVWNGFPLNSSQHGQVDFSLIPVFLADDIEISLSGAAFNQNSGIGGTVSLSNNSGFGKGIDLKIMQTIGSYGNHSSFLDLSYSTKTFQSRTRIFKRSGKNNFTFVNTASWPQKIMRQENADFTDKGFLQEIHFIHKRSKWSVLSWNQWNDRHLPAIMTNLERGGNPKEEQNDQLSRNILSWKYFWQDGQLELSTAFFHALMRYHLETTTQNPPFLPVSQINSVNKSQAWMNKMVVNHRFSDRNDIRFILAFDEEWVETNNYENLAARKSISSKVISSNLLSKHLSSKFSLQYDWVDGRAVGLMPSLSISLTMPDWESLRIIAGASKKYRNPGMNDLHWYPGGNPFLKPEKANVFDLQLAHQLRIDDFELENSITAYYSFIDDWIQWRPTSYRYWIPENIAKVHARGLELHHTSSFHKGDFNFSFAMNHAYTVTTDESAVARLELTSGKQLIYIPRFHGNALMNVKKKSISLYYQFEYTGSRFTNFNNSDAHYSKLPAYSLHHAGIGTSVFNKFDIQFSVQNIYNKTYQVVMWRPMPGRHFLLRMMFELKKNEKE